MTRNPTRQILRSRSRYNRSGLGLIELLISLAMSASLLVAIAMAYTSSAQVIQDNDKYYRVCQSARIFVNRVTTEVRRCQTVDATDNQLDLTTFDAQDRSYRFDEPTNSILMTRTESGVTTTATLVRNVDTARFTFNGKSVSIVVTVRVGNTHILMSGSAAPRRELAYQ